MILLSPAALEDIERLRSFLDAVNPEAATRALRLIWTAIDRLSEFPSLGKPTEENGIRQIVIRFGSAGYIVRYVIVAESGDILITRLWHGREERT
ncbi:type II toxin-antitoxin system RelE/ParE family toxin [Bradyrhizobium huanghuaihaiense]|uniref:type II toxin-antitoxin system RelE/ParE family toxin n=1 Tax=Bradyrhizobium huanghuaihaiense TaxID=990078 RepID=UPI0021AAA90D|nr:type II toxin-antitoxin system RelE/ParE family toxin [Bradyrhizobium sp. CB3035]UWU77349.1 type II toxin-antitoxin system RelE/ParE family toxin [Bradyrhizobium sp. CB3035]